MNQAANTTWFGQRNLVAGSSRTPPREVDIYLLVLFKMHPEMVPPEALSYLVERYFGHCVGASEH